MKSPQIPLLLLAFALLGPVAQAADEPDPDVAGTPASAAAAPEGEATEERNADIDAVLAEEIRAAEAAQAAAPAASSEESFVPTVQISEDLSVSFPVDI